MDTLQMILSRINDIVWGPPMLILLFGTHLFLTFKLKFIQRFIGRGIKYSFQKDKNSKGDISHFGALATSLAATIGTGNIVGVATAVAAGGPGAVLWMWLTGVFGIATKYAEALLSVKYRVTMPDGSMAGGPMYVLQRGLKNKPLAIAFALFTAIAAFGIGNTVQSNSIASMVKESFSIPTWITGIVLSVLTALVILGGIKSIARVCSKLVPVMAVIYIIGCIVLIIIHFDQLGSAFHQIIFGAFTGQAALGGFMGAGVREVIRFGIARGLFSNESGMGSAPIIAAAAKTRSAVRQALVSATGTFWDTVVVCALTGLVIVSSGAWTEGVSGVALSRAAFSGLSWIGPFTLTFGLLTFVFSTILGWFYYGEKSAEYLFGARVLMPYRWLWVGAVMIGAVVEVPMVWSFADIANALMAVPNLFSLIALSGIIVKETKDFFSNPEQIDKRSPSKEYEPVGAE